MVMVKNNKVKTLLRLPQELRVKLEEIADNDTRTLNNLINLILQEYIKNKTAYDNKLE